MNHGRFDRLASITSPDRGGLDVPFDRTPIIETAEVFRVDETLFVMDVFTTTTGRLCQNVEIGGAGLERDGGFMGSMPKVGDKCLVAFPSDDIMPKVLMMLPYSDPRNASRGNRKAMRPGDKILATGFGNHVFVHAGGVIDIASNPITRRLYVPILNQIKDFCENYILNTGGGRYRWDVRRDDKSGDGAQTELIWEIKDFTDAGRVVEIRRGNVASVEDMPSQAVDHKAVYPAGEDEPVFRCTIDYDGNIYVVGAEGSTESYAGQKVISAEGGIVLTGDAISEFDEDPGLTRGSVHISDGDGVQIAQAKEPAVLGDTWKGLMEEYDDAVFGFVDKINQAAQGFAQSAAPAVTAAPGAPNTMGAISAKFASDIIAAANETATALNTVRAKFQTFLAVDTKLS